MCTETVVCEDFINNVTSLISDAVLSGADGSPESVIAYMVESSKNDAEPFTVEEAEAVLMQYVSAVGAEEVAAGVMVMVMLRDASNASLN